MPALTQLHRLEPRHGAHYACCAAWGACYATGFDLAVVVAVLANLVAIVSGNPLAALTRGDLADAVREVGRDRVAALAFVEMLVAQTLAIAVSWRVALGVGLILLLHLVLHLEPVRLARRGCAGPVALVTATVLLPSVTAYSAAGGQADPAVWLVFSGAAALATGRTLSWPDHDRPAARPTTVLTCTAVSTATQVTAGGLLMIGAGLWLRSGWFWAAAGVAACSALLLAPGLRRFDRVLTTVVLAMIGSLA
ncbi:hypothetical protein [Nocardia sp. NRRL S-836]|uniref:hypothetical protein n=1 Tax=Nocardia sp. NRRL S-836 TaxID=1519492 RepID=UPI000AB56F30|nr:hypothetical protein [Nocardia sp. NRRL S-836]